MGSCPCSPPAGGGVSAFAGAPALKSVLCQALVHMDLRGKRVSQSRLFRLSESRGRHYGAGSGNPSVYLTQCQLLHGRCWRIEPFSISGETREYPPLFSSFLGPRGSNPSALSMTPSIITRTTFFFGLVAFFNLYLSLAGSPLLGVGFLQLWSVGFSRQWPLSSQSTGSRA